MAYQGKAALIDSTLAGESPRRVFGNGRFDKRESEMDAHEPIHDGDDSDDDSSSHEAPRIRIEPEP